MNYSYRDWRMALKFLVLFYTSLPLLGSAALHLNTLPEDSATLKNERGSYVLRKCCLPHQYYNTLAQCCQAGGDFAIFQNKIEEYLVRGRIKKISFVTGRLTECSKTGHCPETFLVLSNHTNTLLSSGLIFEHYYGLTYDIDRYCLEMVGQDINSAALALAVCLEGSTEVPKCCPEGLYFDAHLKGCVRNTNQTRSHQSLLNLGRSLNLKYKFDLQCVDDFPVKVNLLSDAYIDECNNICIQNPNECYSQRKYCIDNVLSDYMEPSVYICADGVTKKCCLGKNSQDCACSSNTD